MTALVLVLALSGIAPGAVDAGVAPLGSLPRPSEASRFGWSVAVDSGGVMVVVGAPGIGNGDAPGRAYVFERRGAAFYRLATLHPLADYAKSGFGSSVAIDGDDIVVGAANAYGIASQAYVFHRPAAGWSGTVTEVATLAPTASTRPSRFGEAAAIDGTTAVVGDGHNAFVYSRPAAGWSGQLTESATLSPASGDIGATLAMDGDVIVSGDPDIQLHNDVGVFVRPSAGWTGTIGPAATLSVGIGPRQFGAVDISADTVVVGSPIEWIGDNLFQGAAYVFERPATGWAGAPVPAAQLLASDGGWYDAFGFAVSLSGSTVVVGNHSDAFDGTQNDGVYWFERPPGGWSGTLGETDRVHSTSGAAAQVFGSAVSTADGTTVVGDQLAGAPNNFSGAAYGFLPDADRDFVPDETDNCPTVFNQNQANLDGDSQGDACDPDDDGDTIADGADNCPRAANAGQADLDADGAGDVCDPDDDGDAIADGVDNCPRAANADQANLDGDAAGDACDPDDDGDAIEDGLDNCPRAANSSQYDLDGDAVGDVCDPASAVTIDVMPGVDSNPIRTAGRVVPVAILSSATFDATTRIDQASLRFGRLGTEAPVVGACRSGDANRDGIADLTCDFEVRSTGLGARDLAAVLIGRTLGTEATMFQGADAVTMTKPR